MDASNSARTRTRSSPCSEKSLGVSRINDIVRVHSHRILQEQWLQRSTTMLGSGLFNGFHGTQRRPVWNRVQERETPRLRHTWERR